MRRIFVGLAVLILVLVVLITVKIRSQNAALTGPAGGSGVVEGVEVDLTSRLAARVKSSPVRKGAEVKAGDLLLSLDCSEPEATLAEAIARVAAASSQAKAASSQANATRQSRGAAQAQADAAAAQVKALSAQRDAASRQASRLAALASDVAEASLDQTRTAAAGLEHQAEAAVAQEQASRGQARAVSAQGTASEAQAEAATHTEEAARAALERARLLVAECEVKAPRDGTVAEIYYEVGELAQPGSILVRLIDIDTARVTFYLPNAELAAVRPGISATAVADAWPDKTFTGQVTTVATAAEFTPRNIQTRSDRDRLVYPVEVSLPNPEGLLRPGMPVQIQLAPVSAKASR